jgi:catechol 2,3-dioxygenase-like lactoylglutathione lyase family enzyme
MIIIDKRIAAFLCFLVFLVSGGAHGQTVSRVESVGFTVSDMDRSLDFFTRVLPFEKISDEEVWGDAFERTTGVFGARARVVRLRLGDETIELTDYLTGGGRPVPVDSRSNDRWFQHIAIIVSDMDKAFGALRAHGIRFGSTAPQTLPKSIPNAAGIKAFYFRDIDDHVLEILEFPSDKGAPKWHEKARSGKLFLGIDHTAIVVGETEASLGFYRDTLGLSVAGTSDNFGTEQEHLNNVFGARLHITGLLTREDGIAVEFLEYRAPRDGRAFPADTRSDDIWHWQTGFVAEKLNPLHDALANKRFRLVSNGIVGNSGNKSFGTRVLIVRDPDGHAVRVMETQ